MRILLFQRKLSSAIAIALYGKNVTIAKSGSHHGEHAIRVDHDLSLATSIYLFKGDLDR